MENPANIDIHADHWVACLRELPILGVDLTDAVFGSHIRLFPNAIGVPLVQLATVTSSAAQGVRLIYAGTDTIANHIAAGRLSSAPPGYTETDSVILSLVGIRVDEATMKGLPFPEELSDDLDLAWDLHITPSGGVKDVYARGAFIVRAGATE